MKGECDMLRSKGSAQERSVCRKVVGALEETQASIADQSGLRRLIGSFMLPRVLNQVGFGLLSGLLNSKVHVLV